MLMRLHDGIHLPKVNIIQYLLSLFIQISSPDIVVYPSNEVIFKGAFDELMENIW